MVCYGDEIPDFYPVPVGWVKWNVVERSKRTSLIYLFE